MRLKLLILPALSGLFLTACASGNIRVPNNSRMTVNNVTATSIKAISTSAGIVVNYTQGATTGVTVNAPEEILPYLKVEVVNDKLTCGFKENNINTNAKIVVDVTAPSVTEFKASSGGSIIAQGAIDLNGKDVEAKASSSGKIDLDTITCGDLDIDVSSSGNVTVNATCDDIDVEASSSGTAITNATCSDIDIKVSSSGAVRASANASGTAEAKASSSGTVQLSGSANSVQFNASSSGLISAAKLNAATGSAKASSSGHIACSVKQLSVHTSSSGTIRNN